MKKIITQDHIESAMDWAYQRAVDGIPGMGSAGELAADYASGSGTDYQKATRLIGWQVAKTATTGFLTGLGGIITIPVSLPANIAIVLYVQIRMIAAIACLGGYDLRDDRIKTFVYMCLAGKGASDIAKSVGIKIGQKLTENMIKQISGSVIKEINKKVGFRLLTKFGTTGGINLGKMIPLAGGIIGAAFDGTTTKIIGNVARKNFIGEKSK